jgi:hypothetical protein
MKANIVRTKFTTTLTNEHKKKLAILTAYYEKNGKNDLLEQLIDEKWKCYENEMGNK